uniref:Uncharacterized protein n=1 Tax=viral metagenome TaxID=1070528 RepID=A0A6H1Z8S0_9ZZZZ
MAQLPAQQFGQEPAMLLELDEDQAWELPAPDSGNDSLGYGVVPVWLQNYSG